MEEFIQTKKFFFANGIDKQNLLNLELLLADCSFISKFKLNEDCLNISYYSILASENDIISYISGLGFKLKKSKKQSWLKRKIEKLAQDNKKHLGSKRLDCCDL